MSQFTINASLWDQEKKIEELPQSIRYFKVSKNALMQKNQSNYNIYQIIMEVKTPLLFEFYNNNAIGIDIFLDKKLQYSLFLSPFDIQIISNNKMNELSTVNILATSVTINRLLTENHLSYATDYDSLYTIFKVPKSATSTSVYNFFVQGLTETLKTYYGDIKPEIIFDKKIINTSSITHYNLEIDNNYNTLINYIKNYLPILDYPLFAIDDFIHLSEKTSSKIILNSLNNLILNKNAFYDNLKMEKFSIIRLTEYKNDIDSDYINQMAYGDYYIYDVDNYAVQKGDECPVFTVVNNNGKNTLQNNLVKSIYSTTIDYPMTKKDYTALRHNFKMLNKYSSEKKLNFISNIFTFINPDKNFLDINKIFKINDKDYYYIYANDIEFKLLDHKSQVPIFKVESKFKTINLNFK